MLFKKNILTQIKKGKVRVAFRRWTRCSIKAGTNLHTSIGMIAIKSISKVSLKKLTDKNAISAGFKGRLELIESLNLRPKGEVYQIQLSYAGKDPRINLRDMIASKKSDKIELIRKVSSMDQGSKDGSWVMAYLRTISSNEGMRAGQLARILRVDAPRLKLRVRRLKNLGLTISLGTGYKISPRGRSLLKIL